MNARHMKIGISSLMICNTSMILDKIHFGRGSFLAQWKSDRLQCNAILNKATDKTENRKPLREKTQPCH